jgi:hypothetical protein
MPVDFGNRFEFMSICNKGDESMTRMRLKDVTEKDPGDGRREYTFHQEPGMKEEFKAVFGTVKKPWAGLCGVMLALNLGCLVVSVGAVTIVVLVCLRLFGVI